MPRTLKLLYAFASAGIGAAAWWQTHSFWKTAFVAIAGLVLAFGKKVWSHLEPDWTKRLADVINQFVTTGLTGYGKRYSRHLYYQHRTFDIKGLPTQGKFALDLENVYVDLTVDAAVATVISQNPIRVSIDQPTVSKDVAGGRNHVFAWLAAEPDKPRNFAIVGPPGSGKTTIMKHLTLALASGKGPYKKTPVLLFLRDHATTIGANPEAKLIEVIETSLRSDPPPSGWFESRLKRGECLVMFDGLDEVADPVLRLKVVQWVERQVEFFGANRFIVSSRPNGYRDNPLSGFTVLRVLPFDREQVERFVRNWYLANELVAYQKDDPGVRMEANRGSEDLLGRLRGTPTLQELAVNPLLLTLIATVHRYRNQLPGRRVELYAEICDVFLGKRQQARGIQLDLTPAQKVRVLRVLAWEMMRLEAREISADAAASVIANSLKLIAPGSDPLAFLQMVEDSSALVVEREGGVYGFAHLTFQEYLASLHIKEEKRVADLASHVGETWWHETARLYCAQTDATPIVEKCLAAERPTVEEILLATDCEAEALELRGDLREKIRRVTEGAVEDPEPDRRQLAAEHMLARRFSSMIRVTDDRYVDASPVTHCEYQLFINDMLKQGRFRQPDHWETYEFPSGTGSKPIVGIRRSDAEEFCEWLRAKRLGEWIWMLPTTEDLKGLRGRNTAWESLTFFAKDDGGEKPKLIPDSRIWERSIIDLNHIKAPKSGPKFARARRRVAWLWVWLNVFADSSALALTVARYLVRVHDLDIDIDRDRNIDRNRAHELARIHDLTRVFDLARDRDIDLDPTICLDRNIDRNRDRDRDFARDLARAIDFDRTYCLEIAASADLARNLGLDLDRARARNLDFDLARNLARDIDLARDLALDRDIDLARNQPRTTSFAHALDLARDLDFARDIDLARARDRTRHLDLDLAPVGAAAKRILVVRTVSAFMLRWLLTIESRITGELPVTEGLWIARVRERIENAHEVPRVTMVR